MGSLKSSAYQGNKVTPVPHIGGGGGPHPILTSLVAIGNNTPSIPQVYCGYDNCIIIAAVTIVTTKPLHYILQYVVAFPCSVLPLTRQLQLLSSFSLSVVANQYSMGQGEGEGEGKGKGEEKGEGRERKGRKGWTISVVGSTPNTM